MTDTSNIATIECPHCGGIIEIIQMNCGIFRHGVLKANNQQINPHASKEICDELFTKELIYGCGKPFRIVCENGTFMVVICDYI